MLELPKMQCMDQLNSRRIAKVPILHSFFRRGTNIHRRWKGGKVYSRNWRISHSEPAPDVAHIITAIKLDEMDEAKKCMLTGTEYRSILRDTARTCQIQRQMLAANHWTENGTTVAGIRERTKRDEGACNPIRTIMPTNQNFQGLNHYPKTIYGLTLGSNCYVAVTSLVGAPVEGEDLGPGKVGLTV